MAFSEQPKIVHIGQYSAELDAEAARLPFLFALVFENFNTLCEECEYPAADNAPALWLRTFCRPSFHNSASVKRAARLSQRRKRSPRVGVSTIPEGYPLEGTPRREETTHRG